MIMNNREKLTDENYNLFVKLNYNNPACYSVDEFNDDLKRIKYIKRLFLKYETERQLKDNLIKNHIQILFNVFGVENTTRILFFKIEKKYHGFLKSFLKNLNSIPEQIPEVDLSLIQPDPRIERLINKK
jgi:hypothetical protein